MNNNIKLYHIVVKYLFQSFLLILELGGICALFVWVTQKIVPCTNVIDYVERATLGITIYEVIVFVTLNAVNDGIKDSYLALCTTYKYAIWVCEENKDELDQIFLQIIPSQLNGDMLNSIKVRDEYNSILELTKQKNISGLKLGLTTAEHQYASMDLKWRYTFLLRLFK